MHGLFLLIRTLAPAPATRGMLYHCILLFLVGESRARVPYVLTLSSKDRKALKIELMAKEEALPPKLNDDFEEGVDLETPRDELATGREILAPHYQLLRSTVSRVFVKFGNGFKGCAEPPLPTEIPAVEIVLADTLQKSEPASPIRLTRNKASRSEDVRLTRGGLSGPSFRLVTDW